MMSAQAYNKQNDPMTSYQMTIKKTLEINPKHPLIEQLLKKVEADELVEDTEEVVKTLYELTALRSGYNLKDPADVCELIILLP
jgi:heat shock protein beta